jgi:hypothetical protein
MILSWLGRVSSSEPTAFLKLDLLVWQGRAPAYVGVWLRVECPLRVVSSH